MYDPVLVERARYKQIVEDAAPVAKLLEARRDPGFLSRLLSCSLTKTELVEWGDVRILDLVAARAASASAPPLGSALFVSGALERKRQRNTLPLLPEPEAHALARAGLGCSLLVARKAVSEMQLAGINAGVQKLYAVKIAAGNDAAAAAAAIDDMETAGTCMYALWGDEVLSNDDTRRATSSLAGFCAHERYRLGEQQPDEEEYIDFKLPDKRTEAAAVAAALDSAFADAYADLFLAPAAATAVSTTLMRFMAYDVFGLSPEHDKIMLTQADRTINHVVEHKNEPGPAVGQGKLLPLPCAPECDAASMAESVRAAVALEKQLNSCHMSWRGGDGAGKHVLVMHTGGAESEVIFLHPLDPKAPIFVLQLGQGDAYGLMGAGATVFGVTTDGAAREKYRIAVQNKPSRAADLAAQRCHEITCDHFMCRKTFTLRIGHGLAEDDDAWYDAWEGSGALAAKAAAGREQRAAAAAAVAAAAAAARARVSASAAAAAAVPGAATGSDLDDAYADAAYVDGANADADAADEDEAEAEAAAAPAADAAGIDAGASADAGGFEDDVAE